MEPTIELETRAVDEYAGTLANDLSATQLAKLLEAAAHRGTMGALKIIGLDDEGAGRDIKDIRSFLHAWRLAKKTTSRSLTSAALGLMQNGWKLFKWCLFLYFANLMVDSEIGKKLAAKAIDLIP